MYLSQLKPVFLVLICLLKELPHLLLDPLLFVLGHSHFDLVYAFNSFIFMLIWIKLVLIFRHWCFFLLAVKRESETFDLVLVLIA